MTTRPGDWDKDPEAKAWIKRVRESLPPKIRSSAVVMSLVPSDNKPDVKFAVELGFAIMYDKPIILAVQPGQKVPEHLARVGDEIIEIDMLDPTAGAASIQAAMKRLGIGPEE